MQSSNQNTDQPTSPSQPIPFQIQPPEQLLQNQSSNDFSTGRTLQPLSSEEDIRRDTEVVVTPEPHPQEVTAPITNGGQEASTDAVTATTEQLNPQPQMNTSDYRDMPPVTSPRMSNSKKILAAIFSLVILVGAGYGVYHFFLSGNQQIVSLTNPNLTKEISGNTSYMRPKDWTQVSLADSTSTYGQQKNGRISAFVTIKEAPAPVDANQMDEGSHDKMRELLVGLGTAAIVQPTIDKAGVRCTSKIDMKINEDRKKANGINGLMSARGSCKHEGGELIVKVRSVIGDDRLTRMISVAASSEIWAQDEKALQAVLDSVGQI